MDTKFTNSFLSNDRNVVQSDDGLTRVVQKIISTRDQRSAEALLPYLSSRPDMPAAEARQRMCLALGMHAPAAAAALDAARLDQQSGAYKVSLLLHHASMAHSNSTNQSSLIFSKGPS